MIYRLLAVVLLGLAAPSRGIELSLEENRAERGNIGYIDMTRLFRQFPETLRAKENFEEIVRQTEDQINLRKVEVLKLRGELSQLRMEREILSKSVQIDVPKTPAPAPKGAKAKASPEPAPAPRPKTPAEADLEALKASEQGAKPSQDLSQLPGFEGQKPPEQPKQDTLVINIPGVSTGSVVVEPTAGADGPPAQTDGPPAAVPGEAPATAASPTPAPESQTPAPAPEAAPAPPTAGTAPTAGSNAALAELDARIALRTNELSGKETEFKRYQAEQEKNLLDLESRKTEVLLGKIHRAVQEVARREGVSVVVDKNSILYGHDAVDLTEKVLKFLRGT